MRERELRWDHLNILPLNHYTDNLQGNSMLTNRAGLFYLRFI